MQEENEPSSSASRAETNPGFAQRRSREGASTTQSSESGESGRADQTGKQVLQRSSRLWHVQIQLLPLLQVQEALFWR